MLFPKPQTHRDRKLLDEINLYGSFGWIACVDCGRADGTVVAAHANQGKGQGLKAGDDTAMALCHRCHSRLDQPGRREAMPREERREYEVVMCARTRVALDRIRRNQVGHANSE